MPALAWSQATAFPCSGRGHFWCSPTPEILVSTITRFGRRVKGYGTIGCRDLLNLLRAPLPRDAAEQRRAQRRAALLEAGLEVLGRHGWAAATVRGVCKQAA
nr:hypothetical protein GCM10020093_028680 [Planobispora longispora]